MSNQTKYIPRMKSLFKNEIHNKLMKDLSISNIMLVPKIEKIILNMGLGNAKLNKNSLKQAQDEMAMISGQKAVVTYAKKAISNFKLREGDPVGIKVTLRSDNMYDFLDRFISVASPRIRDFRGISSTGFDGRGNYNFGIDEQIIFPEIDYDKVNEIRGLNCTIVTNTDSDFDAYSLIKAFGFPIKEMITPAEAAKVAAAKAAAEEAEAAAKKAAAEEVAAATEADPAEEADPVEEKAPAEEAAPVEETAPAEEADPEETLDTEKNKESIEEE